MSSRNVRYNQGTSAVIHVHVSVECNDIMRPGRPTHSSRGLKLMIITDGYFFDKSSENCEKCPN